LNIVNIINNRRSNILFGCSDQPVENDAGNSASLILFLQPTGCETVICFYVECELFGSDSVCLFGSNHDTINPYF